MHLWQRKAQMKLHPKQLRMIAIAAAMGVAVADGDSSEERPSSNC